MITGNCVYKVLNTVVGEIIIIILPKINIKKHFFNVPYFIIKFVSNKNERQKKCRPTTLGFPRRSPILVLTKPDGA